MTLSWGTVFCLDDGKASVKFTSSIWSALTGLSASKAPTTIGTENMKQNIMTAVRLFNIRPLFY
ncbi:MAG: hypothetical protein QGI00_10925 [Candidatus Marinimicrobia bacterium]|nr:hypothetical protein [Candidatus Neomarinimicrobiota bacterium]